MEEGQVTLVDLRVPAEREQTGSVPGAVEAPRGMLEFWADPTTPYHRQEFDPNERVILHSASGGRSALAAATLQEMGVTPTWPTWTAASLSGRKPVSLRNR